MVSRHRCFVVGVDGSDCGRRALDQAVRHAQPGPATLLLSYVIPWTPFTFSTAEENALRLQRREEELSRASAHLLEPCRAEVEAAGLDCELLATHGHPARTLLDLAQDRGADAIIVGLHGESPLAARLLGGTASALVQAARCPVLIVP